MKYLALGNLGDMTEEFVRVANYDGRLFSAYFFLLVTSFYRLSSASYWFLTSLPPSYNHPKTVGVGTLPNVW